jgi:hypothetical protein
MLRVFRAGLPLLLLPVFALLGGCSTIYRPVYSPGKSNYKKPPEKAVELLPPDVGTPGQAPAAPAGGVPPPVPAAPAPGLLDAPPAIPGLPQ